MLLIFPVENLRNEKIKYPEFDFFVEEVGEEESTMLNFE